MTARSGTAGEVMVRLPSVVRRPEVCRRMGADVRSVERFGEVLVIMLGRPDRRKDLASC